MQDRAAAGMGSGRERAGPIAVDGERRRFALGLGLVDRRIGRGIDDHIRNDCAHGVGNIVQTGEVTALLLAIHVQRDQLAQRRKTALQLPAYLATFTEQQKFHQTRPW